METSKADTGSSHTINLGLSANALAMPIRCLRPPSNSWGYEKANRFARPTVSINCMTCSRISALSRWIIQKLKDASFVQSMSRKGNCWDNAPQESFFGHMKDEIASLIAGCATYEQVQAVVADWMDYYNKDRYQWDLEKLSPREYYCYRQTGVYPLKPGISKNRNSRGSAPDPEV